MHLFPERAVKATTLTFQNIVGLIEGSIIGVLFLHIGPRDLLSQSMSRQIITRIAWILGTLSGLLVIISFLV